MKRKISKFIKYTVGSVLFLAILFWTVAECSYIFRYDEDPVSTTAIQSFYAQEENTADIAFVGSSAMYRFNIAPLLYHEYGYTSCQFAAAQFPFEATIDVIKEVQKYQNPKFYVIDLRRFYIRLNDIATGANKNENYLKSNESYFSRLVNNMPISIERANIIHKVVPNLLQQDEFDWQFDYYRTHNNWRDIKFSDVSAYIKKRINAEATRNSQKSKYMGAVSKTKVKHYDDIDISKYKKTITISKEDLVVLDELIDYIEYNNLNAMFITTPYPIAEELYAYERFLQGYMKEKNVPYLDCNTKYDEIGTDFYTDYYDKKHTNTLGSYKYMKFLGKYISENFNIKKSELSKETKQEWDAAYNNWWNNVGKPGIEKIKASIAKQNEKDKQ